MSENICIFQRIEKKYRLTLDQKSRLLAEVGEQLIPDQYGRSTICSLYLDTPDFRLIRNSIDATVYKEKLRLRSYGTPKKDGQVFLEIKKKYKGVVYKRRVVMTLREAEVYLRDGTRPVQSQIMNELDYAMRLYGYPQPAMFIAYEREAYYVKDLPNLRLTFDGAVRYRREGLHLVEGSAGKVILPGNQTLLEIKTDGAMPVWLANALDHCKIFPASFSKYGTAYQDFCINNYFTYHGVNRNVCNF